MTAGPGPLTQQGRDAIEDVGLPDFVDRSGADDQKLLHAPEMEASVKSPPHEDRRPSGTRTANPHHHHDQQATTPADAVSESNGGSDIRVAP